MTKGTFSFGKRHTKTHTLCRRCGRHSWHIQKTRCASCGAGASAKLRKYNWSEKAIRRHTTGTGRRRHLKVVQTKVAGLKKWKVRHQALVTKQKKTELKKK